MMVDKHMPLRVTEDTNMLVLKNTTNPKFAEFVGKRFEEVQSTDGSGSTHFVSPDGGPGFKTWVQDRERFGDNYAVHTAHSIYSFLIV